MKSSVRALLGWPLPYFVLPLVGIFSALSTWASTNGLRSQTYQIWSTASTAWHEALWPGIAVTAGASSLIGSLLFGRHSLFRSPVQNRIPFSALLAHTLPLVVWIICGHAVGLLPLMFKATATATFGSLDPAEVAIGAIGVAMVTAVAFAIGAGTGSWLAAPGVALMTFVLAALPNAPAARPIALLQPVQQWVVEPRFVLSTPVIWFSLCAFVLFMASAMMLTSRLLSRRAVPRTVVLAAALGPAIIIFSAFAWRPEFYRVADSVPDVCTTTSSSVQVCVHQAYEKSLGDAAKVSDRLARAGAGPLLSSVVDINVADDTSQKAGRVLVGIPLAPTPELLTVNTEESLAYQISQSVFGGACLASGYPNPATDTVSMLGREVLVRAGFSRLVDSMGQSPLPEISESLARLSDEDFSALIASQESAIAACRDLAIPGVSRG